VAGPSEAKAAARARGAVFQVARSVLVLESRLTTSTHLEESRGPSRPRSTRPRDVLLVSTTARKTRRDRRADAAIEDRGALKGIRTAGCAELVQRREELAARQSPIPNPQVNKVTRKTLPSRRLKSVRNGALKSSKLIHGARHAEVAESESKRASDWTYVNAVAAHKRSASMR